VAEKQQRSVDGFNAAGQGVFSRFGFLSTEKDFERDDRRETLFGRVRVRGGFVKT